ncbi:MAG: response regulator [Lachnospiraceae bacterium]|nr:response regulator [Lachnospiraceae bacterium]
MYKALIIDDERPVQIAIHKLGNWSKYHIHLPETANNGKEALLAMRELHPDLCFVDMQMPIMNGMEYLQKASAEFPGTQFIIISGYDDFKYAHSAIKYGACDYLLKPIVGDDLNAAIERAILKIDPQADFSEEAAPDAISPEEVVGIIKEYIDQNYNQNIKISMFTSKYFFSKEYLSKLFKSKYGCGIYTYVQEVRMQRAKDLLLNPNIKVQHISERLGYADNHYFSKAFKNYYGLSPSQFRKENAVE